MKPKTKIESSQLKKSDTSSLVNQIKTQSFLGSASSLSAQINQKEDNESERTPVPSFGKMSD